MDRRYFLKTLGIGGGAIAFAASHPWIFPETVIPYSGPFSFEWMASEITATAAAKLHGMKLHTEHGQDRLFVGAHQHSCSFVLDSKKISAMSLQEIKDRYIIPTASAMANRILDARPKMSGVLMVPRGMDMVKSCTDITTGLNLRFIRVYDIFKDEVINRCDVLVA